VTGRFRVRSHAIAQVVPAATSSPSSSRAASVTLEVNGTSHPLRPPGVVVGRGTEADLRINDPGISRRHAQFRVTSERLPTVSVADLGSTNGTVVNGRRVGEAELSDGSTVRLGNTDVVVRFVDREA